MVRRNPGPRRGRLSTATLCAISAGGIAIGAPLLQAQPVAARTAANTIPAGFQDWSTHNHDQQHTGVSSETILSTTTTFKLHWSANTGDQAFTSPAIVFNTTLNESLVYVGNMDGEFNAYNAATGVLVWHYQTPKTAGLSKEIESSAAVSNNTVYFGDGDYHEYALNATTGAFICTSQSLSGVSASSPVIGNPTGSGDVVYFGDSGPSGNISDGGHLWAMYGVGNSSGTACATDWSFDNFGSPPGSQTGLSGVWSSPSYATLADGTPVVVTGSSDNDDAIYEFNATTGALLWRFQAFEGLDSDVGAPSTIAEPHTIGAVGSQTYTDGVVYDMSKAAKTYAIDLQTGAQIWLFDVKATLGGGNPAQSGAALVGNFLYIGYGLGVYSLNATTGAQNWVSPTTGGVVSSVAVTGPSGSQIIVVGDLNGNVDVFDLQTDALLFTFSTGAFIYSSAGISTGQFFITSTNGFIYAFGVASGLPTPVVTSVTPNHGAQSGGAAVTVTGNSFTGATDVVFGGVDIPAANAYPCLGSAGGCFQVAGPATINVDTPTSPTASTVDVTVITAGGTSSTSPVDLYTYVASGAYTALTPFRICDTRASSGAPQCSGQTLGAGGSVTVQITGAPIPATAHAVVVNLTAINRSSSIPTFVSAFPAGGAVPLASNINLSPGAVHSNLAFVQLSSTGKITVFNAAGSADVIVDVQGYFAPPAAAPTPGTFHTIPPLRICDSRAGKNTECAGGTNNPIAAGTWRRVVLSGLPPGAPGGTPSIPTIGAAAAAFNLTATAGSSSTFLSVAPPNSSDACPAGAPRFSNLNPPAGGSVPIRVISPLGPHQDICVFNAAGSINFLIDVNGWFGNGHESATGALFYSVAPTRICDTRQGSGTECDSENLTPNDIQTIGMAGVSPIPAEGGSAKPVAIVANLTGVAGTAATVLVLYPSDVSPRPQASDLNPAAGQVIANLAIVGLAQTGPTTGEVNLYNNLGTIDAILDVAGWFQ
jgi:outer membrane protein assembly factor BamB